jgi:two-component system cell cycle sensor histidine kinase/response regulator CckA
VDTILIADDEPGILKLVAIVLRRSGYVVLEAADGLEALQLAAQHPGPIDLLLTDVCMPGLLGPEVCERLRPQRPETRYLLMSGYPEGIEASGLACLAKPFGIPELLQSVRERLDATPGQTEEPVRCGRAASPSSSSR